MNHCHSALLLAVLLQPALALAGGDAAAPAPKRPVATVRSAITAEAVRADVAALSSDEMGGRFFRSPFAEKAAVWITGQFKAIGLAPGMPDGTFRQPIDKNPETGPNMIAVMPATGAGADAGVIIVSSHYDHMRPRRSGEDRIYNGADDNASGVAGTLAVARALKACAAAGNGPACTVIFLAFNGEEAGLLGSTFYARNPTVPLGQVRGVFNMDMISRGPARQIFIDGGPVGQTVVAALKSANESIGLKLRLAEHPDWLDRSDQGPFLARKVPAVLFSVEDHEDYHQVSDEVSKIDAGLAAEVAQLVALATIDMSHQPFTPRAEVSKKPAEPATKEPAKTASPASNDTPATAPIAPAASPKAP